MDLTRRFFDCFVKGDSDNGFRDTPRVRLEVRSNRETVHAIHAESTWPPEKTTDRKLFIRPGTDNFSTEPLEAETSASYGATSTGLSFTHTFSEPTELTGYMKAQLWMAVDGAQSSEEPPNDLLVFLAFDKLDRDGGRVPFYGCVGNREDAVTRGYLAASRRTLDPKASTGVRPVPAHQTDDPVVLGECMRLEISLLPTSVHIEAGESVRLHIASKEILRMPPFRKDDSPSRGRITLFGGGTRDSFLQMPVIRR
jgi:hypothetical protein